VKYNYAKDIEFESIIKIIRYVLAG